MAAAPTRFAQGCLRSGVRCKPFNALRSLPTLGQPRLPTQLGNAGPCTTSYSLAQSRMATQATSAVADQAAAQPAGAQSARKRVVFVIGGPGSGKGTQCELLSKEFGVPFFSAGDLIRSHIESGSEEGKRLQEIILQGHIIPSEITVGLLQKAMEASSSETVLIDGFPRNSENYTVWQSVVGYDCELVLVFDCPEETMLQRLLVRKQGRADDNEETIKKRLKNFTSQTGPVIDRYAKLGKVYMVPTDRAIDAVHAELSTLWRQRFCASL